MSATLVAVDKVLNGASQAIAGVVTARAVSDVFSLTADGSKHLRVDIVLAPAAAVTGSISLLLQTRQPGGTFATVASANGTKTVADTFTGVKTINLLVERSGDQADMPLQSQAQVVITTTNSADAATITHVWVQQGNS